ncbi:MAG: recombinase family protein [Pseudonocardiaceae bacterium]
MSENNGGQRLQPLFSTVVLHGYARVSAVEQNPDAQRDALLRAGVHPDQLYLDHTSGAKSSRPGWDALYKALRSGDVLVATRLDRVSRSTVHLIALLDELARRGVAFRFLEQGIDTTTSEGRLMYRMLAAIAEFQRDLIVANTREGLAAARARGRRSGRKPKLTAQQVQLAQQLYDAKNNTVAEIAAIFKVPRTTIYSHLTNSSVGTRPRARKHTTDTAAPASADTSPARPVSAPDGKPGQQPGLPRAALLAPACPTCGTEPADVQTRWRLRQDLATIWLHLNGEDLREQRHCLACQPHTQPLIIECDLCGDGPLITGLPAELPPEKWPAGLTSWLRNHDWRTEPQPRCGNHR